MTDTKPYTLRELQAKDVFPMFKIISKFGINEFKKCFDTQLIKEIVNEQGEVKGDKLASIVGVNIAFEIASIVTSNIAKCENEIFDFLTSISNLKRKEIETMSMVTFFEMIVDVIQKEEFKDFFGVVSKLFK